MSQRDTAETKDNQGRIRDGYDAAVSVAGKAIDRSREASRDAAQQTVAGIEANPLTMLVGGLAFGVVAAALIPRSEREKELLAPVGKRVGAAATAALAAAKDAGRNELASLGLDKGSLRDRSQGLLDGLGRAAATAGEAAKKAAANTSA